MTINADEKTIKTLTNALLDGTHEVTFFMHNDDGTYTSVCECGKTFHSREEEARHRAEKLLELLAR